MAETQAQAAARRRLERHEGRQHTAPPKPAAWRTPTDETIHASDLSIDKLELLGLRRRIVRKGHRIPVQDKVSADIAASILDASVERTIDGASTLEITIHDPEWKWLTSGLFDADEDGNLDAVDVKLDKLWFRLVSVAPQGGSLRLVFEDREVALLRRHSKPRSVSRADRTRAQFAELLVREVKAVRIKFYSPEKNKKQDIESPEDMKSSSGDPSRQKGINRGEDLTVKGSKMDAAQRANAKAALAVADKTSGITPKAKLALIEACIVESQLRNLKGGNADSVGLLQYRTSLFGSKGRHIDFVVTHFLTKGATGSGGAIEMSRKHPDMSAGDIAAALQGPRADLRGEYDKYKDEASAIVQAWGDGQASGGKVSVTKVKQYRFSRGQKGKREDSWECLTRLAEEVKWRCFMRSGEVWFISEPRLLKQQVLAIVSRDSPGIDSESVRFTWDSGIRIKEVTFDCRAERWSFPPGSVVGLKDMGPASSNGGRWIVAKIRRSLYDPRTSITLTKAVSPELEPAPSTTTGSETAAVSHGAPGVEGGSDVERAYARAVAISNKNYPYRWGGGHMRAGTPDGGVNGGPQPETGFDCSGYTAAILLAGGMLVDDWQTGVPASGTFASSYGSPGRGKHITVWANGGHVFIEFHGMKANFADTSQQAGGPAGPHVRFGRRSTAGFTPRHWPGA